MYGYNRRKQITQIKIYAVIIVLILVFVGVASIIPQLKESQYVATVTDKERIVNGESSYYLIFTKDVEGNVLVLQNSDSLWRGKWDSSNVQGALEVGKTYKFRVYGYRVPFLSWYENIIGYEENK
jgi:hypothetical protein